MVDLVRLEYRGTSRFRPRIIVDVLGRSKAEPLIVQPRSIMATTKKDVREVASKSVAWNVQYKVTTTPFNARSSRFQGVPPRNMRLIRANSVVC